MVATIGTTVVDLGRPGARDRGRAARPPASGSTSTPPTRAPRAVCPELRDRFAGWERADSIVVNPHKWLGVPMDCSTLWTRRPEDVPRRVQPRARVPARRRGGRVSLSEVTQVARPPLPRAQAVGRAALLRAKRAAGADPRARAARASVFEEWVRGRARLGGRRAAALLARLLPPARLRRGERAPARARERDAARSSSRTRGSADRYALRLAVGSFRTTEDDVRLAWDVLRREAALAVSLDRLAGTYLLGVEPMLVVEREGEARAGDARRPAASSPLAARSGRRRRSASMGGRARGRSSRVRATATRARAARSPALLPFERAPDGLRCSPGGRGLVPPPLERRGRGGGAVRASCSPRSCDDRDGALARRRTAPRWRFVEWLTRRDAVIFHGSPKPDIDVFAACAELGRGRWITPARATSRRSTGRRSASGRCGSPSSTARASSGSIRNGVQRWTSRDGRTSRPLPLLGRTTRTSAATSGVPGTLYLLPRETFRREPALPRRARTRASGRARRRCGRSSASPSSPRTSRSATRSAATTTRR